MLNSMILESENIRRNLQSLVLNHPLIYDCTAYHKLHIEMTWLLNSEWKCRQNKMYIKNSGYSGYSKLGWVHPLPSAAVTERFIITMPLLWNLSFSQLHREWSSRCNNNNNNNNNTMAGWSNSGWEQSNHRLEPLGQNPTATAPTHCASFRGKFSTPEY